MEEPNHSHPNATKRILCYIRDTLNDSLFYSNLHDFRLVDYSDSDWVEIWMKEKASLLIFSL